MYTDDNLAAKQRVREAFAPENLLNPGRNFRDGNCWRTSVHPTAYNAGL